MVEAGARREPRTVAGTRSEPPPRLGVPSAAGSSVDAPRPKEPSVPDTIADIPLTTIDGTTSTLADYPPVRLIVNVASRCGLAPQYEKLEALQKSYGSADSRSSASRATSSSRS